LEVEDEGDEDKKIKLLSFMSFPSSENSLHKDCLVFERVSGG